MKPAPPDTSIRMSLRSPACDMNTGKLANLPVRPSMS
jgi:hypothetical protein